MKLLKYEGDAPRAVPGVGLFNKGDERMVEDQVAASFDNESSRDHGWRVAELPAPKKPKPEPLPKIEEGK